MSDLVSVSVVERESSDAERSAASCVTYVGVGVELRQRSVSGSGRVVSREDATSSCGSSAREAPRRCRGAGKATPAAWRPEANGGGKKLEKEDSLDWERYMKENGNVLGGMDLADFSYSNEVSCASR